MTKSIATLTAGALALALAACSGGEGGAVNNDAVAAVNETLPADEGMANEMDANAMDANAVDANAAADGNATDQGSTDHGSTDH